MFTLDVIEKEQKEIFIQNFDAGLVSTKGLPAEDGQKCPQLDWILDHINTIVLGVRLFIIELPFSFITFEYFSQELSFE